MDVAEAVATIVDTFNRRDIEGFIARCAPDAEMRSLRGMVEDQWYRGHDELRQFQIDSEVAWSEQHLEPLGLEARGDHAVVLARLRLRGRSSGAVTERDVAFAIRLREGLVAHLSLHADADAARRELGWES